jgi:uncharacterized protein (TIGR03435 family)
MTTPVRALALAVALAGAVCAQSARSNREARPKFEVASIRPTKDCAGRGGAKTGGPSGGGGRGRSGSPGRIEWNCASVAGLIKEAYGRYANGHGASPFYSPPPVEGGPPWVNSDTYYISAKAEDAASLGTMNGPMLQALLEDRFKLRVHRGGKQVQAYALTATKSGPKLKPFREESCTPFHVPLVPRQPGAPPYCNMMIRTKGPNDSNVGVVDMQPATLDDFSEALARVVGRPVLNRTGIPGTFAIYVEFALDLGTPGLVPPPDAPKSPASDDLPSAASIFSAVQEQLGLKLNSTRGPSEVLIIDRVERASEN